MSGPALGAIGREPDRGTAGGHVLEADLGSDRSSFPAVLEIPMVSSMVLSRFAASSRVSVTRICMLWSLWMTMSVLEARQ